MSSERKVNHAGRQAGGQGTLGAVHRLRIG